jgi:hypothetical protein
MLSDSNTMSYAWFDEGIQSQILFVREVAGGAVWIPAIERVVAMSVEERDRIHDWPSGWWWVRDIPRQSSLARDDRGERRKRLSKRKRRRR